MKATLRTFGFLFVGVSSVMFDAGPAGARADAAEDPILFLQQYCVDCHSSEDSAAGLAFDVLQDGSELVRSGRDLLRILEVVEDGSMPPDTADAPTLEERSVFTDELTRLLLTQDAGSGTAAAPVVMRRLNRQEYDNTLRDLLGPDLRPAQDFPPDDIGFGYDNVGSALNVSPVHVERFLEAAERVTAAAVPVPEASSHAPAELIGLRTYPLDFDGTVTFEHHLLPGRYLVDFSLVRVDVSESVPPPRLVIGLGADRRTVRAQRVHDETLVYRLFLQVAEGEQEATVSVAPADRESARQAAGMSGGNVSGDQRYGNQRGLHVDSMVVRGPLPTPEQKFVDRLPGLAEPLQLGDAGRLTAGRRILEQFASRAFRRPVLEEEADRLMRVFEAANEYGESFEASVRQVLTAVLVSPRFFYLTEPSEDAADRPLTEFELASRLSYFLWSSMPDDALLQAAAEGRIRTELRSHVLRMLGDPKAAALTQNFAGQWLQLRNLDSASPDPELFSGFTDDLLSAMRKETELCFARVVHENRNVLELLDADYTFLNERLAGHYGLEGVSGPEFRLVQLSNAERGGILTQASVLTLTSHHNRTSPVKRGQWILQQLLGTPPPPPPPDVAQLDESPQAAASGTLRERLEAHRSDPECASCHNQMDSLGFGLENYDIVGRWRTTDGDFEIDSGGELPGGRTFRDVDELKKLLVEFRSRRFCSSLIENVLTYSLGRAPVSSDYRLIEMIRQRLVQNDYRSHEILFGIVESDAFQRRGDPRAAD